MTDTTLAELRGLLEKATKGPWEAHDYTSISGSWWFGINDPKWGFLSIGETRPGCDEVGDHKADDARLIVAAINALSSLLSTLEIAEARLGRAVAVIEQAAEAIQHVREMAGFWSDAQKQAFLNGVEQSARATLTDIKAPTTEIDNG